MSDEEKANEIADLQLKMVDSPNKPVSFWDRLSRRVAFGG